MTYLPQEIRGKNLAPQIIYITQTLIKSIVRITSTTKTLWITNVSNVIESGIDTAPTKIKDQLKSHKKRCLKSFSILFSSSLLLSPGGLKEW